MKLEIIKRWGFAFILSFACINVIAFFYNHDAKWLKRDGGATQGVYAPGHFVLRTDEGFGYARIDENGYVNSSTDIGQGYVLVFGKSHTNAMEVMQGERYVDRLDELLRDNYGKRAYCVARGGNTFADLICGFNALIEEFPDSSAVIMEMSYLDDAGEYRLAMNQRTYNANMKAEYLINNQSSKDIISGLVKEYLPFLAYYINFQLPNVKLIDNNAFLQGGGFGNKMVDSKTHNSEENAELEQSLNVALEMVRAEYDGKIIVLFHPDIRIEKDGNISITAMKNYDVLKRCCENNKIELCDAGEAFQDYYVNNHRVPYGFWNTSMGVGHLNKFGHEAISELLYNKYFSEIY